LELNLINNINRILSRDGCRDSVKDFYYNYLLNAEFTYMKSFVNQILSFKSRRVDTSTSIAEKDKNKDNGNIIFIDENSENNDGATSIVLFQSDMDFEEESGDITSTTPAMAVDENNLFNGGSIVVPPANSSYTSVKISDLNLF